MSVAMAVHGGAYIIPPVEREPHRVGCTRALAAGLALLDAGATSLDAVEAAVATLERDGAFGAGCGSALNADGEVELDAGIMDGRDLRSGSVAAVRGVPAAVALARAVLKSHYAVIVGDGAHRFAVEHGIPTCESAALISEREYRRFHAATGDQREDWDRIMFGDTVGAVAVDADGHVAAATATGGSPRKPPGRVGDSPLVGCGLYADDARAAVSTTGHGERLIPLVWAKAAADLVGLGALPQRAADAAVDILARRDVRGGLIICNSTGAIGVAWNTPQMAFAFRASDGATGDGPR
jgi:L-asparaginase / beta-aspartyl-peptidase